MEHEMNMDIEVPMKVKVKFSVKKAVPMTWGYAGGTPPEPAQVDDIQFVLLTQKFDHKENKWVDVEIVADGSLHDAILATQSWDEWQEQCFENVENDHEAQMIDNHEDWRVRA